VEHNSAVCERLCDFVGAVGRSIGHDDDLQTIAWVVESDGVLELSFQNLFLVIGRDDEAHRGKAPGRLDRACAGPRADPRERP
jgi:hypothetical protein